MPIVIKKIFVLLFILTLGYDLSFGAVEKKDISSTIFKYYLETFNISKDDLHLRIVHYPNTSKLNSDNYRLKVESLSVVPKLGYQTLKLLVFSDDILIKRYPVSVEVSIYKDILVTIDDIVRNEEFSREKVQVKKVLLSKHLNDIIYSYDEIDTLVARQNIRKGKILRKSNLREKPDALKGQKVKIKVVNGDLTVTTQGTLTQDANIGEEVRVNCNATGKRLKAFLESPKFVVIGL